MRFVQPITMELKIVDTLLLISALDYLIADPERHEIDRAGAEKLRQRIMNEVEKGGIEIGD